MCIYKRKNWRHSLIRYIETKMACLKRRFQPLREVLRLPGKVNCEHRRLRNWPSTGLGIDPRTTLMNLGDNNIALYSVWSLFACSVHYLFHHHNNNNNKIAIYSVRASKYLFHHHRCFVMTVIIQLRQLWKVLFFPRIMERAPSICTSPICLILHQQTIFIAIQIQIQIQIKIQIQIQIKEHG